jgi:hypothetical protein
MLRKLGDGSKRHRSDWTRRGASLRRTRFLIRHAEACPSEGTRFRASGKMASFFLIFSHAHVLIEDEHEQEQEQEKD